MAERKYILTEAELKELVDSCCNVGFNIKPTQFGYCPYKNGCGRYSKEEREKFREGVLKRYTKNEVK